MGSVNVKHKYTDQEEDAEYGLYYYNARYYDPELSRFVSADSIIPDPSDPQDFNRYSYVSNNPIIYVDPSGHEADIFLVYDNGGSYGSGSSWGFGNYGSFGSWSSWQNSWGGGYGGYGGGGNNALATFAAQLAMMQFMNNYFASMSVAPAAAPAAVAPAAPSRAAAPAVQASTGFGGHIYNMNTEPFYQGGNASVQSGPKVVLFGQEDRFLSHKANIFISPANALSVIGHSRSDAFVDASPLQKTISDEKLIELISSSGWKKGMPIYFFGCEAGKDVDSVASRMARHFGVNTYGPTARLWGPLGWTLYASLLTGRLPFGLGIPDFRNRGEWIEFGPDGKRTRSYNW